MNSIAVYVLEFTINVCDYITDQIDSFADVCYNKALVLKYKDKII